MKGVCKMNRYYSAIVFITMSILIVIVAHLFDNETLSQRVKKEFFSIACLIGLGCLCEYLGICFNGAPYISTTVHGIIKAVEFSIAPIIPILYANIIGFKRKKTKKKIIILLILIINFICELISVFVPFVFQIDENNVYKHAFFYSFYIIMYIAGIVLFIFELIKYTKKYQSRNLVTLISIIGFLISGFLIRLFNSDLYTDWLVVAISLLLFIIYYSDLILKVDPLTCLLNRKSYQNRIKKIDYSTAIIILDANKFKSINDNYGHQAGDAILKIIAQTIIEAYGKYAHCYRIGGDEFCVILKRGKLEKILQIEKEKFDIYQIIEDLNKNFDELLAEKCKEFPMLENGVSKGYGIFYGVIDEFKNDRNSTETISDVIKIADEMMYKEKNNKE